MGALRNTRQKQMVYDALTRLDHPTATQVYECVHAEHPTVSRGTVFRVLGGEGSGEQEGEEKGGERVACHGVCFRVLRFCG